MTLYNETEVRRTVPTMKKQLKILYLHEKESDVIAINEALSKGQIYFQGRVANSKEKFEKALKEFPAQLILAETSTNSFSSLEALEILKRDNIKIPFILVSDHMPIEKILDLIKAGASDYINKDRMERLPIAINSAVEKYRLEKERQEYIDKLENAETRFRALIEHAVEVVVILNKEGKPVYASPSIKRVLGYSEKETLDLSLYTVVHPDDKPIVTRRMQECLKNPGVTLPEIQCRCRHKNGNWVWCEGSVTNMLHDPAVKGIVDNFHDISDKKRAEIELRESEEKYRSFFENSMDAILLTATGGQILAANPAACRMFQMTEQEICEAGRNGLIKTNSPALEKGLEERKNKGKVKGQLTFQRKNGSLFEGEISSAIFSDSYGSNRTSMIIRDISERVKAEKELKISEENYRFLFESSASPKWIFDIETDEILDVNETAIETYGYLREEFLNMKTKQLKPPEELPRMAKIHRELKNMEGLIRFGIFTQLKKDGTRIKAEVSGHKCYFKNRLCMVIDSFDVTEREKTLQQLKDSQEKLITAQKIARLGYWKLNLEDFRIYWSDEIYEMAGLKKGDSAPTFDDLLALIHPDDKENYYKNREETYNKALDHEAQYRIILPGGGIKWFEEKGKFIKDEQGNPMVLEGTVQDITAKKILELSLEESNLRYKMVSKATSDAIWDWDFTTNKAYWGEGFQTIFGYDPVEIQFEETFWEKNIHPEDRERVTSNIEEAIKSNQSIWSIEYRFRRADGTYAYVLDKGFFIRDEDGKALKLAGGIQDITPRKKAEEALRISNERYDIVAKATNDSVWDWDLIKNYVVRPAKTLESVLGYRDIQPLEVDSFWHNHVHPEDWKRISERRDLLFKDPNENYWEDEYRFLKPDGSYATIYDRSYIIRNKKGKAVRMIGASRDISKLKESELQLKLLNEQLEARAKELVASNQELEQFAYVASHDLQEPLRMVSSFLTQIEKKYNDILDEKGKTYIHFAVDGATRMRQMILDLLEFSRAGRNVDKPQEVDLNTVVKDILNLHQKQLEETKAKIKISDLPTLAVPKAGIRQVFQNLISNSLKYNQLAKGVIPKISICAKDMNSHWQFEIKDNGIGIEPQYYEKIFVIFQRLHDRSKYSGTGIGLAITKKIIENMEGKIWIDSEIGKGTTFFFTIPKK